MKVLKNILDGIEVLEQIGTTDVQVAAVVFDSRKIKSGSLFVAQKGTEFDGHLFIEKAIELGALAIVCQTLPAELTKGITYIKVINSPIVQNVIHIT